MSFVSYFESLLWKDTFVKICASSSGSFIMVKWTALSVIKTFSPCHFSSSVLQIVGTRSSVLGVLWTVTQRRSTPVSSCPSHEMTSQWWLKWVGPVKAIYPLRFLMTDGWFVSLTYVSDNERGRLINGGGLVCSMVKWSYLKWGGGGGGQDTVT